MKMQTNLSEIKNILKKVRILYLGLKLCTKDECYMYVFYNSLWGYKCHILAHTILLLIYHSTNTHTRARALASLQR